MSEPITPAISDRICQHMNADHREALLLYAQVYGQTPHAEAAEMVAIDPQGMDLTVQIPEQQIPVRVLFDHDLKDAEDAHYTLIAMIKQARSQQG
jgi:putative heme iron utilization protein